MASADTPTDTSVDCRPTIGRLSVVYRTTVGCLSADSRPIVARDIGRLLAIPDHVVLVLKVWLCIFMVMRHSRWDIKTYLVEIKLNASSLIKRKAGHRSHNSSFAFTFQRICCKHSESNLKETKIKASEVWQWLQKSASFCVRINVYTFTWDDSRVRL